MQVPPNLMTALIKMVSAVGEAFESQEEPGLHGYEWNDISIVMNSKDQFGGAKFEFLGKDLIITNDYEVMLAEDDEDVYEIEDGEFSEQIKVYLKWRMNILKEFAI